MELFHMQTIMFGYLLSNVLVTIVMLNVWLHNRKRFKGTSHWLIYYIIQTIGILLVVLRGVIPDFHSKFFGNVLILISLMFFLVGLQRFMERKAEYMINIVFLGVYTMLYYYFGIIDPSFRARAILVSLSIIIIMFQAIFLLFFKTGKDRAIYMNTAIVCVFITFLYTFRAGIAIFSFPLGSELYSSVTADSIVMFSSQMLGILMTFSLVLMINQRLFIDVQQFAEEKEMMVNELRRLANTDGLTGIFNRSKMEQILTIEVLRSRRYKHPLSVILADVDHFKDVNDTFGHNVGDSVLIGISSIMKQYIREVDTFGRWGGEEFLVICPETTVEGARNLAEKLRIKVGEHQFKDVGSKTISMGVAQIESDEWDEDVIKRADRNLYKAKSSGRNRVE